MFKINEKDVDWIPYIKEGENEVFTVDGKEVTRIKWLITEDKRGAENYIMKMFKMEPGAPTAPQHPHDHEHQLYILRGEGLWFTEEGKTVPIRVGDAIVFPAGESHRIKNTGDEPLEMLCIELPSKIRAARRSLKP